MLSCNDAKPRRKNKNCNAQDPSIRTGTRLQNQVYCQLRISNYNMVYYNK
jgi:hypothetical protein